MSYYIVFQKSSLYAATIAPTGCGDDRDDDRPVYTLCY